MERNIPSIESQTAPLLSALKKKREHLALEYEQKLSEIDRQIEAVITVQKLVKTNGDLKATPAFSHWVPGNLQSSDTQIEALVKIAEANGGYIQIGAARKMLVDAGLIKSKKNSWKIIYSVINRSKKFQRTEKGLYALVRDDSTLKGTGIARLIN